MIKRATIEFDSLTAATKAISVYAQHHPSTSFALRYAAASPTNCVWLGGLPAFVTTDDIEAFCRREVEDSRVCDVFINRPNDGDDDDKGVRVGGFHF